MRKLHSLQDVVLFRKLTNLSAKYMKIFTKIFLSHTLIGFFTLIVFSFIFYFILRDALIKRTIDQLSSINVLKKNQIENHFLQIQKELQFILIHDLKLDEVGVLAKEESLDPNQFPIQTKKEINAICDVYNFSGITVLSKKGQQIFSTTNSIIPSVLLNRYRLPLSGNFGVLDISNQVKSDSTLLLYVIPCISKEGGSYVLVHENFKEIQKLLQETTGMGNTGESYLVGNDLRMRSASRFFPLKLPRRIEVRTDASMSTLAAPSGNHLITDYRGEKVVSYYRKIDAPQLGWTLISEIDWSEAMKPIIRLRNYLIMITFGLSMIIIVSTVFVSNAISRPILYLKDIIGLLSKGVIPMRKLHIANRDEVGQIASAIDQLIAGLKRTRDFAYAIGSGKFDTPFTTLSDQDALGLALLHMRDQLRDLNEREIRLIREKTGAVLEGQENERKRIVQDLHDGVGQLLTAIRLRVEMMEDDTLLRKEIMTLINETITEVKRISYNMMPNAIVDFGLEAALRGLCENCRSISSLSFDLLYVVEVESELNFEISIAIYRIVQEGINNIIKHAYAKNVDVQVIDKGDEIYLLLKDDGRGFNMEEIQKKSGFGIRNMKERATLLNGNLEIHTSPGMGTVIEVNIPTKKNNG